MGYDINKIKNTCVRVSDVEYSETIDSTNLEAKRRATKGADDALLILADNQTAGRGRIGRTWLGNPDTAIAMSLLLRPTIPADKVSMITIIAALAVHAALDIETQVKWPNDIKIGEKKLCGILSESVFIGKEFYSVLGIGINVNDSSFDDSISQIATSLKNENGKTYKREGIVISIINKFFDYYDILCRDGNLKNILNEYNAICISGNINEYGELIMPNGELKRSGEV